jgi:hypothetical protein
MKPHFDPANEAGNRKAIGQKIVALMLTGLRKRGRPKQEIEELKNVS